MRNILLALLLANILYFLWGWVSDEREAPGVSVVRESQLGPKLEVGVIREQPEEPEALVETDEPVVSDEQESSATEDATEKRGPTMLAAVVGRSCVSIGPFKDREDADNAQIQYAADDMRAVIRSTTGKIFVGHWVQIRNVPSREDGNAMLELLNANGLGESYMIETEDEGIKITLGLFRSAEGAEKVELQATSLGLQAEIAPRLNEGSVYFVDIGLPPGKGAGEMIERFGEDKVLLRDAANCPAENG